MQMYRVRLPIFAFLFHALNQNEAVRVSRHLCVVRGRPQAEARISETNIELCRSPLKKLVSFSVSEQRHGL